MKLLNYESVAERLGFKTTRSVYRLVEQGRLQPVYPTKGAPRIREDDLETFIDSLVYGKKPERTRSRRSCRADPPAKTGTDSINRIVHPTGTPESKSMDGYAVYQRVIQNWRQQSSGE